MKIVVLTGSPHKKGTSALLADAFIAGAEAAGHSVTRFDCAFLHIGGCRGCDACRKSGGVCVQRDDMAEILPALLAADLVAFVSPIYYFRPVRPAQGGHRPVLCRKCAADGRQKSRAAGDLRRSGSRDGGCRPSALRRHLSLPRLAGRWGPGGPGPFDPRRRRSQHLPHPSPRPWRFAISCASAPNLLRGQAPNRF